MCASPYSLSNESEAGLRVAVIVLARVQQFLPQIEQSNTELLQRDPRSVDIEHIEETDERVIEMVSAQQQKTYDLPSGSLTWKGTKKKT